MNSIKLSEKIVVLTAILSVLALAFTGCGSGGKLIENAYTLAEKDQYIELPENYLEYEFEEPQVEITDEMVENNINLILRDSSVDTLKNDEPIKTGDKVEITYVAKDDKGETIYSGTNPYKVTIGDDYMSDDLNSAFLGHKAGETVTVTGKVADDFSYSEELRGQNITYEITIVNKYDSVIPELTDEWVKENTEASDVESFRESVKEDLYNTYRENAIDDQFSEYWNGLMEKAKVKGDFPEDLLEEEAMYFQGYVYNYGYNDTGADLETLSKEYAQDAVKMKMILYKIGEDNGLLPTEKEFREYCLKEIESKGYDEKTFESTFYTSPYEYGLKYGWAEEYLNARIEELVMKEVSNEVQE